MLEKEEQLLRKRISELAAVCYQRDIRTNTGFLNLNEQAIFHSMERSLPPVPTVLYGGFDTAERKIVCFLPSYEQDTENFPIDRLEIAPVNTRFSEELGHRDFLGALMGLGVDRSCIGDIMMTDAGCVLFCLEQMSEFLMRELKSVRRTAVCCRRAEGLSGFSQAYEEISGSVSSPRLDSLISLVFRLSRAKALSFISGEKAFINGRLALSAGQRLSGGEIVSVRGLGKFCYVGAGNGTRKGRMFVTARRYT